MVISALMVDTARYTLAKAMVSSAGDLTMNAALADYDTILKDVYGLFAVSQSDKELQNNVKKYFEDTLVSYGVVGKEDAGDYVSSLLGSVYEYMVVEEKEAVNFLPMSVSNVKITPIEQSSLANPDVLEKQIVEYMKYRGPVDFGMSFLDSLSAFTKVEKQTDVVEAQVKAQEQMQPVAKANEELYKAVVAYDERYNELEPVPPAPIEKSATQPEEDFRLKNYGHLLKGYRSKYQEVHRITLIFCSAAYLGKWTASDTKLKKLNEAGDYITGSSGNYSIPTKLINYPASYANLDAAKASVDASYAIVSGNDFAEQIKYLASLFGGGDVSNGTDFTDRETAIRDFQKADEFYKTNNETYYNACKTLDEYAYIVNQYDIKAQEKIDKLTGEIDAQQDIIITQNSNIAAAELNITTANSNIDTAGDKIVECNNDLGQLRGENSALYDSISGKVDTYYSNLESLNEDNLGLEQENALRIQNSLLKDAANAEQENAGLGEEESWWEIIIDKREKIKAQENFQSQCRTNIEKAEGDKITAGQERAEAEVEKQAKEAERTAQEAEKTEIDRKFQEILGRYALAVNTYNKDIKQYYKYIGVAQEIVTKEVSSIASEFKTIQSNVESLKSLLETAKTKLETSKSEIEKYRNEVKNWNTQNTNYKKSGEDNFAAVNDAEIQEANETFDMGEIQELLNKMQSEVEKIQECLRQMRAEFTYMGTSKVKDITTAENVKSAIERSDNWSGIRAYQSSGIINSDACNNFFQFTDNINEDFLKELNRLTEPYPCCVFMNYLRQTFDRSSEVQGEVTETEQSKRKDNKKTYETIKGNKDITQMGEDENKYGYTYEDKASLGGTGWPSSGAGKTNVTANKNSGSDGLSSNKSAASNLFRGLGSAMETGRDKLLVLSYLFENFSYNTIVQDIAREEGTEKLSWNNCSADKYQSFLNTATNSRGISINGANNKIYGAEIEYVLFGNENPKTNVTYTKGGIFAIRFLFNTIFAFTDSGIRNETRGIALGVQAASAGVIPYQIVQVILQLAYAMGESAIDLKNMEAGAKVPIVKSKETWTMSGAGLTNLVKDAGSEIVKSAANGVTEKIQGKITEIVDAKTEELSESVNGIEDDLKECVNSAVRQAIDGIFSKVEAIAEEELNKEAAYYKEEELKNLGAEEVKDKIRNSVNSAFSNISTRLDSAFGGLKAESIEGKAWSAAKSGINDILGSLKNEILTKLNEYTDITQMRTYIYKEIYGIKQKISSKLNDKINGWIGTVSGKFTTELNNVSAYVKGKANERTEGAKEEIVKKVNDFIDKTLDAKDTKMNTSGTLADKGDNAVNSSSKASIVTFGYSDYLKLFVFIGLCANDKSGAMVSRIADIIQLNIQSAGESSDIYHPVNTEFTMANAKTYVSVTANVDLELMFLKFGIFQKQVEQYNEELEESEKMDLGSTFNIHYVGISGY